MSEERFLDQWQENEEEQIINLSLRPQNLSEFIGQQNVISSLDISINFSFLSSVDKFLKDIKNL